MALRLKDDGWRVAIHYGTNHAAAEEVKQALGDAWAGSYACDLDDPAAARAMMQQVLADLPVQALVNNAGIYTKVNLLEADAATLQEVYETTMRVNFYSPLAMIHEAVAHFAKQGGATQSHPRPGGGTRQAQYPAHGHCPRLGGDRDGEGGNGNPPAADPGGYPARAHG